MKIMIATDEGELIDTIENVEEYDLTNPASRTIFVLDVNEIIKRGKRIEAKQQETKA